MGDAAHRGREPTTGPADAVQLDRGVKDSLIHTKGPGSFRRPGLFGRLGKEEGSMLSISLCKTRPRSPHLHMGSAWLAMCCFGLSHITSAQGGRTQTIHSTR